MKVILNNETGLHARPAAMLVATAQKFKSDIFMLYKDSKCDIKSIINIMAMGVIGGAELDIIAEGPDADEAIEAIVDFLNTIED